MRLRLKAKDKAFAPPAEFEIILPRKPRHICNCPVGSTRDFIRCLSAISSFGSYNIGHERHSFNNGMELGNLRLLSSRESTANAALTKRLPILDFGSHVVALAAGSGRI